jgi:hypothetical protein
MIAAGQITKNKSKQGRVVPRTALRPPTISPFGQYAALAKVFLAHILIYQSNLRTARAPLAPLDDFIRYHRHESYIHLHAAVHLTSIACI